MIEDENYIKRSNNWRGNYAKKVYILFREYPWTLAFLFLAIAVAVGIYRVEQVEREYIDKRINTLIDKRVQELSSRK